MAGLITGVMAVSTVHVAAPNASADIAVTSQYDQLSQEELQKVFEGQQIWKEKIPKGQNALGLLATQYGPGWCIDWGVDNPWNNPKGYSFRKLTGQSGRYGVGNRINPDVEKGAINLMKAVLEDQEKGDIEGVKRKMMYMQALVSNNLAYLNEVRPNLMGDAMFTELTGFEIRYKRVDRANPGPNYYLVVNEGAMEKVRKSYNKGEYIVVLMPNNYNLNFSWRREYTSQRLITPYQPGLEKPKQPKPQEPHYTNTTVTLPKSTVTTVVTVPEATETRWEQIPPTTKVTTVTKPAETKTTTVTHEPSTVTTTKRENGKDVTVTKTITPEPSIVETVVPGSTVTNTTTVTERPVVTTVKEHVTPTTETHYTTVPTTVEVTPSDVTETKTEQSTVTTTSTNVNVQEIIKEYYTRIEKEVYEIHNTIDIRHKDEKKILDMGDLKKQGYSWRITKGEDLVIVDRDKDNNLIIKPKDDFKGSGVVEIVVTDENGNEYIYELQINDRTGEVEHLNKIVNNYFYNINLGGSDRTKIITLDKGDKVEVLEGGDIAHVNDDDPGKLVITPKYKDKGGQVIVKITSKNGEEKQNIITIENINSTYKVTREILNTSVGFVERRGGTKFEITSDENKVIKEIVEDGDNWKIVPNEGAEGEATVTFTDKDGRTYEFTFIVKKDVNAGPDIRDVLINHDGKVEIERRDNYTIKIVSGEDYAKIIEENGKWVVKPTDAAANNLQGSQVVVQVNDDKGELRNIWNIQINPALNQDTFEKRVLQREAVDRSYMTINAGNATNNNLTITEGEDLVVKDEKNTKTNDNGDTTDLRFRFKPGTKGQVKIQETMRWLDVEDIPEGSTVADESLLDPNNDNPKKPKIIVDKAPKNKDGKRYVDLVITEWVVDVEPGHVQELNHEFTTDNDLTIQGTDLKLIKGEELLKSKPEEGSIMKLEPKREAEGTVVVENRTNDGYVFERYTINFKPGRDLNKVIKRVITTDSTAKLARYENDKVFKVLEGTLADGKDITSEFKKYFKYSEETNEFQLVPLEAAIGKVFTFQIADDRGVYANYEFTVGTGENKSNRTFEIPESSEFRVLQINPNTMVWVSGSENFTTNVQDSGSVDGKSNKISEWVAKPVKDSAGKSGIVQEVDPDGNVVNRYTLNITAPKVRKFDEVQKGALVGETQTIEKKDKDNTLAIVKGRDLLTDISADNSVFTPTDKAANQSVVVEEYNANGDLVTRYTISVLPKGWSTSEGANIADPNKLFIIKKNEKTGVITIQLNPDSGVKLDLSKVDFDIVGGKATKEFKDGKWIITPEKNGNLTIVPIFPNSAQGAPVDVEVNITVTKETKGSSNANFKDPKCIAGLVGMASPLLLLIPLGILSQVRIPGLESLRAEVNAAIKRANDDIQRGLGIYDRDRAERAAGLQGAFQVANPQMIGLAGGALGAITAGLIIMDVVLRSCGVDEATSSYQLGKATGNQTLIDGSSKKDDQGTEEAKPAEDKPAENN